MNRSGSSKPSPPIATLKERTRERVPLQWATTQNNLGSALQKLGERESGTERLIEAVAAYRDALTVLTPDTAPRHQSITLAGLRSATELLQARLVGGTG